MEFGNAADLPATKGPSAPPLIFSWDGVYLGTQVGYGLNNVSEHARDIIPGYAGLAAPVDYTQNYTSRGPLTGFHFGYNKQYGAFVVGGEAEFSFAGQGTNKTAFNSLGYAVGGPIQTNIQDSFRWSARGRAGYADGRALYYVIGGMASGGYTVEQNYWSLSAPNAPARDYFDIERFGWTLGAGVEYAFTNTWSGRLEYRHSDFGTATVNSVQIPGVTFRERASENSMLLGVSYHIGAPPILAAATSNASGGAPEKKKAEPAPPPPVDPTFIGRLYHAYADEWGAPLPDDPNAPQSRRAGYGPPAAASPPYPFTEWPYGGATPIAVSLPNAIDSPLMKAVGPTPAGKFLEDNHVQVYGWVDAGFNISTARSLPGALNGGNAPTAYSYQPNIPQLDQAVVIIERVPDTVQKDHWDWGFRILADLWRNLSLHDGFRFLQQTIAEMEPVRRL